MPLLETLTPRAGVVQIQLNRPEKRNALSFQLLGELYAAGRALRRRRDIRAVILTGAGPSFSAGIDLSDLRNPKNKFKALLALLSPRANMFQKVFLVWRELPVPVIAAIHGHCYGAAMQLALGADFRIATPTAELAIMEAKWGLLPDMAASVTLRGLVGLDRAKELTMTARVVSGLEAHQLGLVSHVDDDPLERALQLAAEIMERSPDSVAGVKQLLNAMQSKSEYRTLALERKWQLRLLRSRNFVRAAKRAADPAVAYEPRQWD
ncbi:MAG: crotonase/enoyl-CoA hydratase family protein [Pirellulaceae bacterium]|nr:crotonase/enoyl-CoA hydratase family protein [Pirellulaceae bacterium]